MHTARQPAAAGMFLGSRLDPWNSATLLLVACNT